MQTNLERVVSDEGIHYNQYDQVALLWNMYKISYYNRKLFHLRYPGFTQMTSQGGMEGQNILLILALLCFSWNNLWSVCRYIPFTGCSSQDGMSQQHLAAPIWKCMSGIGDRPLFFLMDLLSNNTFYTNLTIFSIRRLPIRRCDKIDSVQFMKSWENYATSFDAGLRPLVCMLYIS